MVPCACSSRRCSASTGATSHHPGAVSGRQTLDREAAPYPIVPTTTAINRVTAWCRTAQLWRGVRMQELLLYWGGDERGSDFAGPREDFPICVPVGTIRKHVDKQAKDRFTWTTHQRSKPFDRCAWGLFVDGNGVLRAASPLTPRGRTPGSIRSWARKYRAREWAR